jgi:hypothetical protein
MSVRCDGSIPSLGVKCPRHRRGNYKRGDDGTVGSIALCQERTWRASIEMRGVSVADGVTPFDSHERGSEQSDQLFLSASIREHLCLGQREGAASFHHAPTGKDALACGGSEKVDLELCCENSGASRYESKRSLSRRGVGAAPA